jgi:hypothetical protein
MTWNVLVAVLVCRDTWATAMVAAVSIAISIPNLDSVFIFFELLGGCALWKRVPEGKTHLLCCSIWLRSTSAETLSA